MSQYRRPSPEELLKLARAVAVVAHSGQTRRGNGEPYFNHVERVANSASEHSARAAIIGFLHDTIEDTTITRQTLLDLGFDHLIAHDVTMLTRAPDEPYLHYIGRLIEFGSEDALHVKVADLRDNLASLDSDPAPGVEERRTRYLKALHYVLGALVAPRLTEIAAA